MVEIYEYQYDVNDPSNYQDRTLKWESWNSYKNSLMYQIQPIENISFPSIPRNAKFTLLKEVAENGECYLQGYFYHPALMTIVKHEARITKVFIE